MGNSDIQSVIFKKKFWTLPESIKWLKDHNMKTNLDEKTQTYRFRQTEPEQYTKFRIIKEHSENGKLIEFVIGFFDKTKGGSLSDIADEIKKYIPSLIIVGSISRKKQNPNDIDFITNQDLDKITNKFNKLFGPINGLYGKKKFKAFQIGKVKINLWKYENNYQKLFLYLSLTSSKGFLIGLKKKAINKGLKLTNYGLFDNNQILVNVKNEKDIFKKIGAVYRKIEDRQ